MKVTIQCLFLSLLLILAGCSPKAKIEVYFNDKVTDRKKAEAEIYKLIEYAGKPNRLIFNWNELDLQEGGDMLTVSLSSEEIIKKETVDGIALKIKQSLVYVKHQATLEIKITEDDEKVLKLLELEEGFKYNIDLDWSNAKVDVFYSTMKLAQYNQTTKHYYCAIKVEPKTMVPNLSYSYNTSNAGKGLTSVLSMLRPEAKSEMSITGINEIKDYKIKTETPHSFYKNGLVYLMFSSAGSQTDHNDTSSFINSMTSQATETQGSCLRKISKASNQQLYGLHTQLAAVSNVTDTKVLAYE